jgi:Zn ribbon nucleic-acid-binding protein
MAKVADVGRPSNCPPVASTEFFHHLLQEFCLLWHCPECGHAVQQIDGQVRTHRNHRKQRRLRAGGRWREVAKWWAGRISRRGY